MKLNRLHPFYIIEQVFSNYKILLPVIYMFLGKKSTLVYSLLGGAIILMAIAIILGYFKIGYYIKDDTLFYNEGISLKKEQQIPFQNIQNIDTNANIIYQILGLVSLDINLVGETIKLRPLKKNVANELAEKILNGNVTERKEENDIKNSTSELLKINNKDLVLMSFLRLELIGTFFIIFAFYDKIEDFVRFVTDKRLDAYLEKANFIDGSVIVNIIMAIIGLAILFIVSFLRSYIKFYDFKLVRRDDSLVCKYGLFDKKSFVIKRERIQAVKVTSNWRYLLLGKESVVVTTLADKVDDDMGGKNTIHIIPLADKAYVDNFLKTILGLEIIESTNYDYSLPQRANNIIVRFIYIRSVLILVSSAALIYFIDKLRENLIVVITIVSFIFLVHLVVSILSYKIRIKEEKFTLTPNQIIRKSTSFLSISTEYLNFVKIGDIRITRTYLLRRNNLCAVNINVHGTHSDIYIGYLEEENLNDVLTKLGGDTNDTI